MAKVKNMVNGKIYITAYTWYRLVNNISRQDMVDLFVENGIEKLVGIRPISFHSKLTTICSSRDKKYPNSPRALNVREKAFLEKCFPDLVKKWFTTYPMIVDVYEVEKTSELMKSVNNKPEDYVRPKVIV